MDDENSVNPIDEDTGLFGVVGFVGWKEEENKESSDNAQDGNFISSCGCRDLLGENSNSQKDDDK